MDILIGSVFIAGILSFFSPCIVPLIPVYIGILTETDDKKVIKVGKITFNLYAIFRTLLFIAGLSTAFLVMGFGAGALGSIIKNKWFFRVLGFIVILMGLQQIGILKLSFLSKERKFNLERSRKKDYFGAYLLGLTFSFGWTPCVGPVLGSVIGITVHGGKAFTGAFYMLVYSVGLAIPFIFITIFSGFAINSLSFFEKHVKKIQVIGGVLIIIMGLLLMFEKMHLLMKI